jgi:hypothetical protein
LSTSIDRGHGHSLSAIFGNFGIVGNCLIARNTESCKMKQMMNMIRLTLVGLIAALLAVPIFAGQKAPSASINVVVVREANGKPVRNAEVVLHPVDEHGKQRQEGLELKTHEDGKAEVSGLAYGKWRIQVIARGFKTYGEDYDINQPNHEITIKLQKPSEQYSIYK